MSEQPPRREVNFYSHAASLTLRGPSRQHYTFKKNEPTPVIHPGDLQFFKNHTQLRMEGGPTAEEIDHAREGRARPLSYQRPQQHDVAPGIFQPPSEEDLAQADRRRIRLEEIRQSREGEVAAKAMAEGGVGTREDQMLRKRNADLADGRKQPPVKKARPPLRDATPPMAKPEPAPEPAAKVADLEPEAEKAFVCPWCHKSFEKKKGLTFHQSRWCKSKPQE